MRDIETEEVAAIGGGGDIPGPFGGIVVWTSPPLFTQFNFPPGVLVPPGGVIYSPNPGPGFPPGSILIWNAPPGTTVSSPPGDWNYDPTKPPVA